MSFSNSSFLKPLSRRGFLTAGVVAAAGLAVYSGEIERHWIEVTHNDVAIRGLPGAFDGVRLVQLSDIHMDEYSEPFFLRQAVDQINRLNPDAVLLTGDFVSDLPRSRHFAGGAAWQCASILKDLHCPQLYAVLGNHDISVGARNITAALTANGIAVLRNAYHPIERFGERVGGRIWLAGIDDPYRGKPDPERAIPASIRHIPNEPVILMCHAPDYVDELLTIPSGQSAD
jgi:hypothetical protein